MKDGLKDSLNRLQRLAQIRDAYVSLAEARVKQAEREMRILETADNEVARKIQDAQAGIAHLQSAAGHDIQLSERYICAQQQERKMILQSLEKATANVEEKRGEWTEAVRERKIIEKIQERQLHQWRREDDVAIQQLADENSVGRYVRSRIKN